MLTEVFKKTGAGHFPARSLSDGEDWLADLLKRSRKQIVSEAIILSPDRAQALLDRNPDNRNISQDAVEKYAIDIQSGRWTFNGEPIIIADTGELNDGQHRCAAVIRAGRAIEVMVVCGVSRAARMTTDVGMARHVGHFLGMSGMTDANMRAAVASLMMTIERAAVGGSVDFANKSRGFTKSAILQYAKDMTEEFDWAVKIVGTNTSNRFGSGSRIIAAIIWIARTADKDDVEAFFRQVLKGENLAARSAALHTHNRLIDDRKTSSRYPARTIECLIRGWNAHRTGSSVSRIVINGAIPQAVA